MKTHLLYCFKDCDLFMPLDPLEAWQLIVDQTPQRKPIAVLLPPMQVIQDEAQMKPYVQKARIPLLFPKSHLIVDTFREKTLNEHAKKALL